MPIDLSDILVVGISSRALFDLEAENEMFERDGVVPYTAFQLDHTEDHPGPGTGFHIVKSLLSMNDRDTRRVEVIVLSRNNAATSLRVSKAIEHYGLDRRAVSALLSQSAVTHLRFFPSHSAGIKLPPGRRHPGRVPCLKWYSKVPLSAGDQHRLS